MVDDPYVYGWMDRFYPELIDRSYPTPALSTCRQIRIVQRAPQAPARSSSRTHNTPISNTYDACTPGANAQDSELVTPPKHTQIYTRVLSVSPSLPPSLPPASLLPCLPPLLPSPLAPAPAVPNLSRPFSFARSLDATPPPPFLLSRSLSLFLSRSLSPLRTRVNLNFNLLFLTFNQQDKRGAKSVHRRAHWRF
jgi:hypothetical protein